MADWPTPVLCTRASFGPETDVRRAVAAKEGREVLELLPILEQGNRASVSVVEHSERQTLEGQYANEGAFARAASELFHREEVAREVCTGPLRCGTGPLSYPNERANVRSLRP